MKRPNNFITAASTALLFIVCMSIFASCIKERDHDTYAAEDATFALWVYDDAINIANEAATLNSGDNLAHYKTTGFCGQTINSPGQIIVAFGNNNGADNTNCLCNDGRNRRGKIIVNYTGVYNDSNAVHTMTFENYFVDDNEIKGTQTIQPMGLNDNGVPYYTSIIDGEVDILDSLGALTYNAEITRTWTSGSSTVQWGDDSYELTGTAQGVNIYGNNYAFNVLEPIVKPTNIACRYFTTGILEVQPQGRTFRSIDFGTGNCDATATVTIDNKQHNMIMK